MSGTGKVGRGTTKTIYEVNANMVYHVKGVPFDASVKIANRLMEAIEPFDYKDMVKFESKYLQGFYADKYEQLPSDMTERITRRISKFSRDESDIAFKKYDDYEKRFDKGFTWLSDASMKYCLLPVWFMTVAHNRRAGRAPYPRRRRNAARFLQRPWEWSWKDRQQRVTALSPCRKCIRPVQRRYPLPHHFPQ